MKYEYPLRADYIKNWGLTHAFRELIANAKDADAEGFKLDCRYVAREKKLYISNDGVTLEHDVLLFGGSNKSGKSTMIGQYGEGLKLALLVLAREGIDVKIRNGRYETWTPSIEWADQWKAQVLVIQTRNLQKPRDLPSFDVEIGGMELETWHAIENLFLFLNPATTLDTRCGQVLTDAEHVGRIYVKGVYATMIEKYDHGYNFYDLDTGRDRQIPQRWQMDDAIKNIWDELAQKSVDNADTIYKMLESDRAEASGFRYTQDTGILERLSETFKRQHGELAVPVTSVGQQEQIKHLGYKGVLVPYALADQLHKTIPTPDALTRKHSEDVTERMGPAELTKGENTTLQAALSWFEKLIPGARFRVVVARFRDDSVDGIHSGNEILLARRILSDFGLTLMVLAHEFAHDKGSDGSFNHVDEMQKLVQALFNAMHEALEEK